MKGIAFAVLLAAASPLYSHAVPITPTVTSTAGTSYKTSALTGYMTTNATMVGSQVSVKYADGTTDSAVWTTAGALGKGWSLKETGDTSSNPWTFANTSPMGIEEFSFDGVPGNTTFDIIASPVDTPGSSGGIPFSNVNGPAGLSVAALYTDQLLVNGIFYGDEYTKLIVSFAGAGLKAGQSLSYFADTDNAPASSGITVATTPEPSTLALLGTGILGAIGVVRRRLRA